MKHFITSIVFSFVFAGVVYAQDEKTIYIIDGYTLKALTDFTVVSGDPEIRFKIDSNTIVTHQKSIGSVVISKEGYITSTFELKEKGDQNFLIKPTKENLVILREKYVLNPETIINVKTSAGQTSVAHKTENDLVAEPPALETKDTPASFPGGNAEISRFFMNNLRFPDDELNYGVGGKIHCKFVVTTDGTLSNISFPKGLTMNTELETLRVLKLMPKWIPAKHDGKPVNSYFILPVNFALQ